MEDYTTPTLESITAEADRAVLAEHRGKLQAYGESVVSAGELTAEKIEELTLLSTLVDAIDARDTEIVAAEEAAAEAAVELAAKTDALASKFAKTEKIEDPVKVAEKQLTVKLPSAPVVSDEIPSVKTPETPAFNMTRNGVNVTAFEMAEVLASTNHKWAGQSFSGREKVTLFSSPIKHNFDVTFTEDALANYAAFNSKIKPSVRVAYGDMDEDFLVASGGYCAPLNVDYSIPAYSEICDTIDSFFPNVNTTRGGIKYMIPPANTLAAGIAVITCLEDRAGYTCETPAGTTPCKPTTTIGCPTQAECCVDIITQSVTFGNLNHRTFPELIDWAMHELAVEYSRKKNQYFLDKLFDPTNSVSKVSSTAQYDGVHNFLKDLITLAIEYRNDNKMCYGSGNLLIILPRHIVELFRFNALAKEDNSAGFNMTEGDVRSMLGNFGFRVGFYEGFPTAMASGDKIAPVGATTAIAALPLNVWALITHPDSFVVLRGGSLDFGLVRDSQLNHANNLEIMSEEFCGLCRTGLKAITFKARICPNGTFAGPTAPFSCP